MAYAVQRRTSELGIRMALGARRLSVIGMVIREALAQGLAGVVIGVPAAIAGVRLVANQLYGVSVNDPMIFRRRGSGSSAVPQRRGLSPCTACFARRSADRVAVRVNVCTHPAGRLDNRVETFAGCFANSG